MSAPTGLSFKGCTTREAAIERMGRFLDQHYDAQVRTIAARWSEDDGATCDPVQFQIELDQLRAAFTRSRAECLAGISKALDEAGRS